MLRVLKAGRNLAQQRKASFFIQSRASHVLSCILSNFFICEGLCQALIKETRDLEDYSFWGAQARANPNCSSNTRSNHVDNLVSWQGIPGFSAHLKARFGSVLAAWRGL